MPDGLVLWAAVGFGLVCGTTGLVWYLRRRATASIDDPSILLAAPPEGMTPATATVVDGAPVRLAFIAGMIDLASRGEITFVDEGSENGATELGIAIGRADLDDARIQSNRRRPAGEAEAWLLGQLELTAEHPHRAPWDADAMEDLPQMVETAGAMFGAVLRQAGVKPDEQVGAAASAARQRGLLSNAGFDAAAIEHAYESQTGHAVPAGALRALEAASVATPAPVNDSADPDDSATTPSNVAGPKTTGVAGTPGAHRLYISARTARTLTTPFLFGTFLDTYARRHGWLPAMPFLTRLRWRIAGVIAAGVGVVVLTVGVDRFSDGITGLGTGVFFGGLVVIWRAPAMVQPTVAGGRAHAQLAAYRRTLEMTFRSASSLDDAVGPAGLPWLETPDQAVAWAVALGLASAVTAVLDRANGTDGADQPRVPVSLDRARQHSRSARPDATASAPAQLFAAIQDIGRSSEAVPSFLRPMRSWWS